MLIKRCRTFLLESEGDKNNNEIDSLKKSTRNVDQQESIVIQCEQ